MNPSLHHDVTQRILRDYEFKTSNQTWLRGGRCPSCGHKELFTNAKEPWVLKCGRLNKCGAELHIKDIYDDLFSNWSDRYESTPKDPNAAADAYMREARGFDLALIKGWYSQESYYDKNTSQGSATVRFELPGVGYWERIIDRPQRFGKRKANFKGEYAGKVWEIPGVDYVNAKEIWIVEGIFDAIAHHHHGVVAVSAMSCNNNCWVWLKRLAEECEKAGVERPRLIWAFDDGPAGNNFTKKHVQTSRDNGWQASAAFIRNRNGKKMDWNELHQFNKFDDAALDLARYNGALLLAKTASDKALLIYNRENKTRFWFGFDNRMYWFDLDLDKFNKAANAIEEQMERDGEPLSKEDIRQRALSEAKTVFEIANCYFTALYYQANEVTDESWYYLRVDFPHDGASIKNTFAGGQLTKAATFKDRLISIAPGAIFSGNSIHLSSIIEQQLFNIKTVQTITYVGYTIEHGTYVFNDVAVKDGRVYELNEEDFFDIGKLSIKSLMRGIDIEINSDLKDFHTDWITTLWECYKEKGIVVLAFWLGSLFAEQLRAEYKSFPFLEFVGDPGSGKSTLIEFLWKLLGRNGYEGFDPSKSSAAARARNFSQVANMPVVLIEGDRAEDKAHAKQFDFNELKPLYDGRSIYSRGVKNSGNDTYEPPFRGSVVISQNADVAADTAVLQRIVQIKHDTSTHTPSTKKLADSLKRMKSRNLSGFAIKAMTKEQQIMERFRARFAEYEPKLQQIDDIKSLRIVENHAQIMALVDCLPLVVNINEGWLDKTNDELVEMAIKRQHATNEDHPIVQEFWDIYEFLNGDDLAPRLNHSRDPDYIAINLNHFVQVASDKRQQVPNLADLKKHLKSSRKRKFVEAGAVVNSAINERFNEDRAPSVDKRPESVRCWKFENLKGARK